MRLNVFQRESNSRAVCLEREVRRPGAPGRIVLLAGLGAVGGVCVMAALTQPQPDVIRNIVRHGPSTVLAAQIQPAETVTIYAEIGGTVQSMQVEPGEDVKAGQPVGYLVSPTLQAEVERAEARAAVLSSRAAASRGQSGSERIRQEQVDSARAALLAAEKRLSEYSGGTAEASLIEAKNRTETILGLYRRQIATKQELDEASERERLSLRELRNDREHWSRLQSERNAAELQLHLLEHSGGGAAGPEARSAALELAGAETEVRIARERLKLQTIYAPRTGKVLEVSVRPGERVLPGSVLIHIADVTELMFEVPITPHMATRVRTGTKVVVRIPTDPPVRKEATVSSVSLAPDVTHHHYVARIRVPSPNPEVILAGLEGAVEFPH